MIHPELVMHMDAKNWIPHTYILVSCRRKYTRQDLNCTFLRNPRVDASEGPGNIFLSQGVCLARKSVLS